MSSEDPMSTTENPDDTVTGADDAPLTERAAALAEQADSPVVEEMAGLVRDVAGRAADAEAKLDFWKQQVQAADAELDRHADRLDAHDEALVDLRHELESFIGPAGKVSGREKRLKDIRAMMVSVARGTDRPVKWSRGDIKEQLLGKGYDEADLPADTMFNDDIHDLADTEPGFRKEKKTTETADGRHREVWHLVTDPDALPGHEGVEAASSTTTARGGRETTSTTSS